MLIHPLAERLRALGMTAMADTFLQGHAWESLQPCTLSGLARVVRHEGELAIER